MFSLPRSFMPNHPTVFYLQIGFSNCNDHAATTMLVSKHMHVISLHEHHFRGSGKLL